MRFLSCLASWVLFDLAKAVLYLNNVTRYFTLNPNPKLELKTKCPRSSMPLVDNPTIEHPRLVEYAKKCCSKIDDDPNSTYLTCSREMYPFTMSIVKHSKNCTLDIASPTKGATCADLFISTYRKCKLGVLNRRSVSANIHRYSWWRWV